MSKNFQATWSLTTMRSKLPKSPIWCCFKHGLLRKSSPYFLSLLILSTPSIKLSLVYLFNDSSIRIDYLNPKPQLLFLQSSSYNKSPKDFTKQDFSWMHMMTCLILFLDGFMAHGASTLIPRRLLGLTVASIKSTISSSSKNQQGIRP